MGQNWEEECFRIGKLHDAELGAKWFRSDGAIGRWNGSELAELGGATVQIGRVNWVELGGSTMQNWQSICRVQGGKVGGSRMWNWEAEGFTIGKCNYAILARWRFRFGR